jgi:hypothetical protein
VHADTIDNSTQRAIALIIAGNLEWSWYYMLLSNEQKVKRIKATPLPMTDEVIAHLTSLSDNRESSKTVNVRQPVFEQITMYCMMMMTLMILMILVTMSNL